MGKTTWQLRFGDTFGRGTVVAEIRMPVSSLDRTSVRGARLICECGTVYDVRLEDLTKTRKPTQSCGCLMRETASVTMRRPENLARLASYNEAKRGTGKTPASTKRGERKRAPGLSRHPLYGTWCNMLTRCYNPNYKQFKDYGGRGIEVCRRWRNSRLFIEDIERLIGPRLPGMTLDRINNDGNYEEGNVKWSTYDEQVRNSRKFIDGSRSGALYQLWWRLMRQRPDEVCEHWHDWPAFRDDIQHLLGERLPGHRFTRLDDTRPYEPGNVTWVTGAEQVKKAQAARWGESRPEPKHGMFGHPLYNTWKALVNEHSDQVHEPWQDVRVFVSDVETELGPKPAGTAFRLIDPDGRYEPGNICWGKRGRPSRGPAK